MRPLDSAAGTTWADTDVARYELRGAAPHTQHVANFLAAIAGDRDVVCTGADGMMVEMACL